jgi:hypothetical protein
MEKKKKKKEGLVLAAVGVVGLLSRRQGSRGIERPW